MHAFQYVSIINSAHPGFMCDVSSVNMFDNIFDAHSLVSTSSLQSVKNRAHCWSLKAYL